jgi:hypothetical protein
MGICLKCDWEEYWGEQGVPYPGDEFMVDRGWHTGTLYRELVYSIEKKAFSHNGVDWFPVPEPVVETPPEPAPEPVIEPKPWELHPELYTTVNTAFGPHHVLKRGSSILDDLKTIRDLVNRIITEAEM